jgi:chromosome segregation ATPase
LKAENEKLRSELDAREDPAPLRAELEQLQALMSQAKQIEAENARLRSELADTERVGDLSAELEMLRAERTSHGAAMSRLDDDLQRMRKANEQLRSSVDELRAAAEDGVPDAELLNRATVAELEATRAAQATDAAEAHAVLARLEPLLSQAKLAEGEVE